MIQHFWEMARYEPITAALFLLLLAGFAIFTAGTIAKAQHDARTKQLEQDREGW